MCYPIYQHELEVLLLKKHTRAEGLSALFLATRLKEFSGQPDLNKMIFTLLWLSDDRDMLSTILLAITYAHAQNTACPVNIED